LGGGGGGGGGAGPHLRLLPAQHNTGKNVDIRTHIASTVWGSNPRGGRDFPHLSRPALELTPASYRMGTGYFPGVKWLGRDVNNPPHLAPRLKKEWSFTSNPPLGFRGLLQGEIYLLFPHISIDMLTSKFSAQLLEKF